MSLPTPYQEYIFKSRYARWLEPEQRREEWEETVNRYVNFWTNRFGAQYPSEVVRNAITHLDVMPSMRALMTAGEALSQDEMAGYNCAAIGVDDVRCFDEILYILMCGTGVGFSVEKQFTSKLPIVGVRTSGTGRVRIVDEFEATRSTIVVEDSKIGWAKAFRELLAYLYYGQIPSWDMHLVRPAGARLKTFGGRASGPEPLEKLFHFTVKLFHKALGRQLSPLECHDLLCQVADTVVVGGVRRSALISISDLGNTSMRDSKSANGWWDNEPQRMLANNSAVYDEKPSAVEFMGEWHALAKSGSGERGIFNRYAIENKVRKSGRRVMATFLTNPCAEIVLRASGGLCNLTEVVVRRNDTLRNLMDKVRAAAIMGTFQSTLTNFRYVRRVWSDNAKAERLLGVSLTGIMDHPVLSTVTEDAREWLSTLKQTAIDTNKIWAGLLGIPQSAAVTTVKPSGTVSQLVDAASGLHPRYSPHYIRSVRADKKDPLAKLMRDAGFRVEDAYGKEDSTDVFYFPVQSPQGSVLRHQMTALEQLKHYHMMLTEWCEHNASITVYVRDHEWMEVGAWVHKHFDEVCGVSFLPHSDHIYRQPPYEECSETEYHIQKSLLPQIDWTQLKNYETGDTFNQGREFACTANACEYV